MLPTPEKIIFAALVAATAVAFLLPIVKRLRIVLAGKPEYRLDRPFYRLFRAAGRVFLQLCTLRIERPLTGLAHVMIFYGALTFDTMALNHTLEGFIDGFHLFGNGWFGDFFYFLIDLFAVTVMIGVVFFAFRRFVVKPAAYKTTPLDSALIYIFITLATLTYLYFETFSVAVHPDSSRLNFIGKALSGLVYQSGLSQEAMALHFRISWWAHIVAVFAFISYVPHSKYLHMFTGPINVLFRRPGPSGELKPEDLENSEVFGYEKAADFTWKDNLDAFACVECGRCQDVCPAYAAGKPLSPKMILVNMEKELLRDASLLIRKQRDQIPALVPGTFSPGEIWTCTTCGACMDVCPVEIDHLAKIIGSRKSQVMMESRFPAELTPFFRNIETNSNPWNINFSRRAEWASGLDVKHIADVPDAEYLLWVGCFGAFDDFGKKTAGAMVKIMNAAGLSFGILGTEEKCCGDSARRLGNEYLFQKLALENIALMRKYGVRKIVAACPHGYNTLKNEYPKLLAIDSLSGSSEKERTLDIEVLSHVELISQLLSNGRLRLSHKKPGSFTFHDPCYLGRHNGIIDEPRQALAGIMSEKLIELRNHGRRSFCCGAGGGLMWTEDKSGRRINHLRTEEIIEAGVSTVVTACPFCLTMLLDGLKELGGEKIEVTDIAQTVSSLLDS